MLKNARKEKGLKQYELANKLGISASYLCKIENNKNYRNLNININLILKISNLLDLCPVSIFIYLTNNFSCDFSCPFRQLNCHF